jgi:hypothetical protein
MKHTIKALRAIADWSNENVSEDKSISDTEHQKNMSKKLDNWDADSPADLSDKDKSKFFDEVKKKNFADEEPIRSLK